MIWIFIAFLLFFVLLIFGAHWLTYFSLVRFFNLENHNLKLSLAIVLTFLSISFLLFSFLAHWKENELTRFFYLFSNLWLAFFNNLFLALLLAWAIKGSFKLLNWNGDFRKIAGSLILVAILVTVWGIWNAFNPVLKEISVKIKNLPVNWQGKKVVQISDVHLGNIYRQKNLEKTIALVNSTQSEAVFITGDLFDGMDKNLNHLAVPLENLQAENIFLIMGNHETYVGVEKVRRALKEIPKIKILEDEMVDLEGLKILGLRYPERGKEKLNFQEVFQRIENYNREEANILLYHEPRGIQEAKEVGINLQLSGHTHKGQTFPFNFITAWIYQGFDYGLFSLEDYNLYTTTGTGTWGPPMRIGNRPEVVVITLK